MRVAASKVHSQTNVLRNAAALRLLPLRREEVRSIRFHSIHVGPYVSGVDGAVGDGLTRNFLN